jgi:hypothetical protein
MDGTWTSFLQEDDGLTVGGPVRRTRFELTRNGADVTVRARSEGDYTPHARFELVAHGGDVQFDGDAA